MVVEAGGRTTNDETFVFRPAIGLNLEEGGRTEDETLSSIVY